VFVFVYRSEVEGHEEDAESSFHIQQDEGFIHPDVRDWSAVDLTLEEPSQRTTGYS
jgi:hypothetical protein